MNRPRLLVAAMLAGALAAAGCSKPTPAADANPVAPEEDPDTAPVVTAQPAAKPSNAQDAMWLGFRSYLAPVQPPAVKVEAMGRAPGDHHFWAPGYWRWNGREHLWYPGRWLVRRDGFAWVGPHWENRYGSWYYVPGHWRRL